MRMEKFLSLSRTLQHQLPLQLAPELSAQHQRHPLLILRFHHSSTSAHRHLLLKETHNRSGSLTIIIPTSALDMAIPETIGMSPVGAEVEDVDVDISSLIIAMDTAVSIVPSIMKVSIKAKG